VTVKSAELTPVSSDQMVEDSQAEKKIGFSPLIIGIIILVLGILGGIGYYIYRKNKEQL